MYRSVGPRCPRARRARLRPSRGFQHGGVARASRTSRGTTSMIDSCAQNAMSDPRPDDVQLLDRPALAVERVERLGIGGGDRLGDERRVRASALERRADAAGEVDVLERHAAVVPAQTSRTSSRRATPASRRPRRGSAATRRGPRRTTADGADDRRRAVRRREDELGAARRRASPRASCRGRSPGGRSQPRSPASTRPSARSSCACSIAAGHEHALVAGRERERDRRRRAQHVDDDGRRRGAHVAPRGRRRRSSDRLVQRTVP